MIRPELTPKQEIFVREYLVDSNGTKAAIRAGYTAKSADVTACKMLRVSKIKAAVEKGRAEHAKRCNVTVDSLTVELEADRALARQIEQPSSAISATVAIAKLHGLDVMKSAIDITGNINVIASVTYADSKTSKT